MRRSFGGNSNQLEAPLKPSFANTRHFSESQVKYSSDTASANRFNRRQNTWPKRSDDSMERLTDCTTNVEVCTNEYNAPSTRYTPTSYNDTMNPSNLNQRQNGNVSYYETDHQNVSINPSIHHNESFDSFCGSTESVHEYDEKAHSCYTRRQNSLPSYIHDKYDSISATPELIAYSNSFYDRPPNRNNDRYCTRLSYRPYYEEEWNGEKYTRSYSTNGMVARYSGNRLPSSFPPVNCEYPCKHFVNLNKPCGSLLVVLLRLSHTYDFSLLHIKKTAKDCELNPNAKEDAKLCFDYVNTGKCRREKKPNGCAYRHLPSDHILSIMEKIRSGKNSICLVQYIGDAYYIANMPGYDENHPGELNPAAVNTNLACEEFSQTGKCEEMERNGRCPYRHLVACHPERIAYLFMHHMLSDFEIKAWILTPCGPFETNPFSRSTDSLCHDFISTGVCKRFQAGKICRFRHLLSGHPDLPT